MPDGAKARATGLRPRSRCCHCCSEMASPSDRRAAPRGPIRLRVDYERMNAFLRRLHEEHLQGGTFIKTARPLPVATRFLFALAVPALSEPVTLDGEVTGSSPPRTRARPRAGDGNPLRLRFRRSAARVRGAGRAHDGGEPRPVRHPGPACSGAERNHSSTPRNTARVPGPIACAAASPPETSTMYRDGLPTLRRRVRARRRVGHHPHDGAVVAQVDDVERDERVPHPEGMVRGLVEEEQHAVSRGRSCRNISPRARWASVRATSTCTIQGPRMSRSGRRAAACPSPAPARRRPGTTRRGWPR